ncbi:hypothetical protein QQ008_00240 [Fulvivirgaceae bacterium BMA10]|uniref:Uncharacterized protein n=1 Tax=Splendidivirga corallicola TaxID=3051826 RepID=A0ABT8KGD0_9BACT|nr:hypothetical protein [Fulvivirgaceae bacterium BMA10]
MELIEHSEKEPKEKSGENKKETDKFAQEHNLNGLLTESKALIRAARNVLWSGPGLENSTPPPERS